MTKLGLENTTKAHVRELLEEIDNDHNGEVEFEEFVLVNQR